jgi:hypothetical protein
VSRPAGERRRVRIKAERDPATRVRGRGCHSARRHDAPRAGTPWGRLSLTHQLRVQQRHPRVLGCHGGGDTVRQHGQVAQLGIQRSQSRRAGDHRGALASWGTHAALSHRQRVRVERNGGAARAGRARTRANLSSMQTCCAMSGVFIQLEKRVVRRSSDVLACSAISANNTPPFHAPCTMMGTARLRVRA